jgi:hypothetical protein
MVVVLVDIQMREMVFLVDQVAVQHILEQLLVQDLNKLEQERMHQ